MATDDWSSLSEELQLRVLSAVPGSKSKLALRFVSKSFAALLDKQEAHHGLATDFCLKDWSIPLQYLRHLEAMKVAREPLSSASERCLVASVAVATRLKRLELTAWSFDALPYLEFLEYLKISFARTALGVAVEARDPLDPHLLPSLKHLVVSCHDAESMVVLSGMCKQLVIFPQLAEVRLDLDIFDVEDLHTMSMLQVPAGCKLALEISLYTDDGPDACPPVLLKATSVYIAVYYCEKIDVGFLRACEEVSSLCLDLQAHDGSPAIVRAGHLPSKLSCFSVLCYEALPSVSCDAILKIEPSNHGKSSRWVGAAGKWKMSHTWLYYLNPDRASD